MCDFFFHQEFHVPKMEVLNRIAGDFLRLGFPLDKQKKRTAYIGEDSCL